MSPTEPRPTPRHENIVRAGREIARGLNHDHVGVEHLFLAIVRDPHSLPTQVLASSGVHIADLERNLPAIMDSDSYKGIPGQGD
ncbi:Clp protease N-terminal domain-containing protein [Streptosporangium sp. NPDC050855]|uniref:Clp protease N-terminal domain-containing protein n=1 Tax=Streptosporangium sp. NPDC050855 TaxID=3366194 RepID=UPI0037B36CB4